MADNITTPTEQMPAEPGDSQSNYKTIAEFISDVLLMLNNTKANTVILDKMTAAGYLDADIDLKITDTETLRTLNEKQLAEYGEQYEATAAWQQAKEAAHATYMEHLALARIAFRKNVNAQHALGLQGERARSQAGYIDQGLTFYKNLDGNIPFKAEMLKKGVTHTMLLAGSSAFNDLQTLRHVQQKESGEAQQATAARDAAYDTLAEWVMDFRDTARVVLAGTPQLMEEIGIKQTS